MATIVKHYDKKTGKTRVYESTPHYDPISQQSRPTRKYLGTLDPETNELIPSSGRRGRRPSSQNDTTIAQKASSSAAADLERAIHKRDHEIASLKAEVRSLKATLKTYEKAFVSISKSLDSVQR